LHDEKFFVVTWLPYFPFWEVKALFLLTAAAPFGLLITITLAVTT
jgi:hypothetical protein